VVDVRNGIAFSIGESERLGGAQGFSVKWQGVLLVDEEGSYCFTAGIPSREGRHSDGSAQRSSWRMTLQRGAGHWVVFSRNWAGEERRRPEPLFMRRGAYQIMVEFAQPAPVFDGSEEPRRQQTGFHVRYCGPDTCGEMIAIPHRHLFVAQKDPPANNEDSSAATAGSNPAVGYISSLRDIRRTYLRALKALLFAQCFDLSARPITQGGQSELGYLLSHSDQFGGVAFRRGTTPPPTFVTHRAQFDFNFLPVRDSYNPPTSTQDQRVAPSLERQQAMFDWWERVFDYTAVRNENRCAPRPPLWFVFSDAGSQPASPARLLVHMDIAPARAGIVMTFLGHAALVPADLLDERWLTRVWKAELWSRCVESRSSCRAITASRPDLWASDDPSAGLPSGNDNLTQFTQDASFENGEPRRYEDLQRLNDGLRERGRAALLDYLCRMNRVPLPAAWGTGGFAQRPRDLSDLLLLDVEAGLCERASRIEDAVTAISAFVQRARIGIEPGIAFDPEFHVLWDSRFRTFRTWEVCRRREVYPENWIEWEVLEQARRSEGFRLLEEELQRAVLSIPLPAGLQSWVNSHLPPHRSLKVLQVAEPSVLRVPTPGPLRPGTVGPTEGFSLLGVPEADGRPSWLSSPKGAAQSSPPPEGGPGSEGSGRDAPGTASSPDAAVPSPGRSGRLPLWTEAAVRLGARFLRIAACGEPPATALFEPAELEVGCCHECGEVHPPGVDEYYFWLADTAFFDLLDPHQDGDLTGAGDVSAWEDPQLFPSLLSMSPGRMVHLHWCRMHDGEFGPPLRSSEGVLVDPTASTRATLQLRGRKADSLVFRIDGGVISNSAGPTFTWKPPFVGWPTESGFRFDLATDEAILLPLTATPVPPPPLSLAPPVDEFAGLQAYPFFVYRSAGAPITPNSSFGPAIVVAAALRARCQFDAALRWYELAYPPLVSDNAWCLPQPSSNTNGGGPITLRDNQFIGAGNTGGPCCRYDTPSDDVAERRAISLEFLETLLEWGQALIGPSGDQLDVAQPGPESFAQARVILETAATILGPMPRTVVVDHTPATMSVLDFQPSAPPLNPHLLAIYERVSDSLGLIRACENRQRRRSGSLHEDRSFWGNDPVRDGWETAENACEDQRSWCLPHSPYRFAFLVQKSLELAGEVRGLGAALLAAIEKGDAEYLATLRAAHEQQLLGLGLKIREDQLRDADWQVQALKKAKESAQEQLRYYTLLAAPDRGLIGQERVYEDLTGAAIGLQLASQVLEAVAQVGGLTPTAIVGTLSGAVIPFTGSRFTEFWHALAQASGWLSADMNTTAALNLTQAGWTRRLVEWQHQIDIYKIQIDEIQRQILGAERRADVALRELNNQQRQIEHSREVNNFLSDKFSGPALYRFLQRHTTRLHRHMYDLAYQSGLQAQRAFNYERGHTTQRFINNEPWDNLHAGLLAGERLEGDLRRMEKAYQDMNLREYELTKHISLRLHFPVQYLQLREAGCCEIEIPEWLLALDYPSLYMQRIKNVSLSIPCVVGPYTGVHCRLTLLSSETRIDPRLLPPEVGCCEGDDDCDGYSPRPGDPRIVRQHAALQAIATSSGRADSGMFEVNFRDDRYLPFEYAGAVSRWRIELPPENNFFDLDTVTDVIMHLNFTAREGGEELGRAANSCAQRHVPGDGVRLFDVRTDLPGAWRVLRCHDNDDDDDNDALYELDVCLGRHHFPFQPGRRELRVRRLDLLFEAPDARPGTHHTVAFHVGAHRSCRAGECDCRVIRVCCVASREWPGLFHGVVSDEGLEDVGLTERNQETQMGAFVFPRNVGRVGEVFLIAGYEARHTAADDCHCHTHCLEGCAPGAMADDSLGSY